MMEWIHPKGKHDPVRQLSLTRISHGFPTTTCCTALLQRLACFLLKQGVLTQHFIVNDTNLVTEPFTSSRNANP